MDARGDTWIYFSWMFCWRAAFLLAKMEPLVHVTTLRLRYLADFCSAHTIYLLGVVRGWEMMDRGDGEDMTLLAWPDLRWCIQGVDA